MLPLAVAALVCGALVQGEDDERGLALDELIARVPPVGKEWVGQDETRTLAPASAELQRRLKAGAELSSEQWRRLLLDGGALRVRARWPAGEPLAVSARDLAWLDSDMVLVLDPLDANLRRVQVGLFGQGCGGAWMFALDGLLHQPLGHLPLGEHVLTFRIEMWTLDELIWPGLHPWLADYRDRKEGSERGIVLHRETEPRKPRVLATGELTWSVEIVPTLDDAIPPVTTPELDRAVERALSISFQNEGGDVPALRIARGAPILERLGLSLLIEVRENSEVRESVRWSKGKQHAFVNPETVELSSLPRELERDPFRRRPWTVHVSGTSEGVLRSWGIDRRWSGTLILPLEELVERGRAPAKR